MFTAPPEATLEWNDAAVEGSYRFLRRVWAFGAKNAVALKAGVAAPVDAAALSAAAKTMRRDIHTVLRQANYDYERMQYNTVVSAVMKMLNTLEDAKVSDTPADAAALAEGFSILLRVLYPVCPHIAQTLWNELGATASVGELLDTAWPEVDEAALVQDEIELMLQVSGKLRGAIRVPAGADKTAIEAAALASEDFQKFAAGAAPKKIIVVPGRLVNVVI
jgi:leucyl-tRNA synthetase